MPKHYYRERRPQRPAAVFTAIVGAFVGIALFFGSFPLLWWNEQRPNLSALARTARVAPPDRVDPSHEGALVSVTAHTAAESPLGDSQFLKPADRVALERRAEMFSWVEQVRDRGSVREYLYVRQWSAQPPNSAAFQHPRGHENPPMRVASGRWTQHSVSLGAYHFDARAVSLPALSAVSLAPDALVPNPDVPARIEGAYLFAGSGSTARPDVGDVRWSYVSLDAGKLATLFGAQRGARLEAHYAEGGQQLFHLLHGSREAALLTLARQHVAALWTLRLLGVLLLWVSMNLVLGPVNAVLDVLPPLGRASRSLVASLTLPPAITMAVCTVLLANLWHAPFAAVLGALALGAGSAGWLTREKRR